MQFNKETYSIMITSFITFFVLLTVDIYQIFSLPFTGAVHWMPELLTIFLLSKYVAQNFNKITKWSIFCCVLSYPILYQSNFGLLVSAIFGSSILAGYLYVDVKERKKTK